MAALTFSHRTVLCVTITTATRDDGTREEFICQLGHTRVGRRLGAMNASRSRAIDGAPVCANLDEVEAWVAGYLEAAG